VTLVLFSREKRAWKIADFGLASEGTSKHANTTRYSRGTSGYRAPELVKEEASYNNKVDIWAVGCILYEIAARKKAFSSDYSVLMFTLPDNSLELRPQIPSLPMDERSKTCLSELVNAMLDLESWRRPSTSHILRVLYLLTSSSLDPSPYLPDVYFHNPDPRQKVQLLMSISHPKWREMRWSPRWYVLLLQFGTRSDQRTSLCCKQWLFESPHLDALEPCRQGGPQALEWIFTLAESVYWERDRRIHEFPCDIVQMASVTWYGSPNWRMLLPPFSDGHLKAPSITPRTHDEEESETPPTPKRRKLDKPDSVSHSSSNDISTSVPPTPPS